MYSLYLDNFYHEKYFKFTIILNNLEPNSVTQNHYVSKFYDL